MQYPRTTVQYKTILTFFFPHTGTGFDFVFALAALITASQTMFTQTDAYGNEFQETLVNSTKIATTWKVRSKAMTYNFLFILFFPLRMRIPF